MPAPVAASSVSDMFLRSELEAERLGLERVVVGLRDQAEFEHLFGFLELRDRIVRSRRGRLLQVADAAEHP